MQRFQAVFDAYRREDENEWSLEIFETGGAFQDRFKAQYDLIFLDIELPDLNGIEIGREIRSYAYANSNLMQNMAPGSVTYYKTSPWRLSLTIGICVAAAAILALAIWTVIRCKKNQA